jgi:hypothetical protein
VKENVRQWTGIYASCPSGWCDGRPHAAWVQWKIRAAKQRYGFCLVAKKAGDCTRHRIPLTALDRSCRPGYGCEICADELGRLLHSFDIEFVQRRTFIPPEGALTDYGKVAALPAICGNRECRRRFMAKRPGHVYCCEKCYQKAKWTREKTRKQNGGKSARVQESY